MPQEMTMSVAKVSEISSSSTKSFEDAIASGLKRFSRTVDGVQEAWVHEQKVKVSGDSIAEYRVTMKVTFIVKD
jgi:dodecin